MLHHPYAHGSAEAGKRLGRLRRAFLAAGSGGTPAGLYQRDLRHRRVSRWLAAAANPPLEGGGGHSDVRTTMSYTHLAQVHLRPLVEGKEENLEKFRKEVGS